MRTNRAAHPQGQPYGTVEPVPHWIDTEIRSFLGMTASNGPLRPALDAWQAKALWQTVTLAAKESLFFRKHWQSHTKTLIDWERARPCSLQESAILLRQLPFCSGRDIAAASEPFLAVPHDDVAGLTSVPTSGTTGKPKRIYCTSNDMERTTRFFQYGMRFMVAPEGKDRVAMLMSGERPGSIGALFASAMERWNIPCRIMGLPDSIGAVSETLLDWQPTCIVALPEHAKSLALALGAESASGKKPLPSLRSVLLSADASSPEIRQFLAESLQCAVFDHYGLTEAGYAVAVECHNHRGGHIREGDLFFEVVDPEGRNLPANKWGELVMTTLTREAMPLVRYKTGDLGRMLCAPCPCGSALHRLEVARRL